MILAKVTGNVVSSIKNKELSGKKLLIVQPVDPEGNIKGGELVAIDTVCAGKGDTVIVVKEGSVAQQIFNNKKIPVHTVITGIVDKIELSEEKR
ncbi:MAG: EutN/CcmL family microcompartment protein [Candidatus Muiribacteriota bacterium]